MLPHPLHPGKKVWWRSWASMLHIFNRRAVCGSKRLIKPYFIHTCHKSFEQLDADLTKTDCYKSVVTSCNNIADFNWLATSCSIGLAKPWFQQACLITLFQPFCYRPVDNLQRVGKTDSLQHATNSTERHRTIQNDIERPVQSNVFFIVTFTSFSRLSLLT